MEIKAGVKIVGLRPEMILGIMVVASVYADFGYDFVITSALDSKHSNTSLHYIGCAIDIRTKHLPPGVATAIKNAIKEALTSDFDVILESNHIHLEFQPRNPW